MYPSNALISHRVSAHHICHHQGVFLAVIITLSNGLLHDTTDHLTVTITATKDTTLYHTTDDFDCVITATKDTALYHTADDFDCVITATKDTALVSYNRRF